MHAVISPFASPLATVLQCSPQQSSQELAAQNRSGTASVSVFFCNLRSSIEKIIAIMIKISLYTTGVIIILGIAQCCNMLYFLVIYYIFYKY
jgi:hypothetical protein